jgi:hypothetical protein
MNNVWYETTLNYQMMVERYPNLKEEVGGSNPGYEISSLPYKKKTYQVGNCLLCFGVGMSASYLQILILIISMNKVFQPTSKNYSCDSKMLTILDSKRIFPYPRRSGQVGGKKSNHLRPIHPPYPSFTMVKSVGAQSWPGGDLMRSTLQLLALACRNIYQHVD